MKTSLFLQSILLLLMMLGYHHSSAQVSSIEENILSGLEALYQDNWKESTAFFQSAIEQKDSSGSAYYYLSKLSMEQEKDPLKAMWYADSALYMSPENPAFIEQAARAAEENYKTEKEVDLRERLVEINSFSLTYRIAYFEALLRDHKIKQAITQLDILASKMGRDLFIYIEKSKLLQGLKDYDESERVMEHYIELYPTDWKGYQFLGALYLEHHKIDKAKSLYQDVLKSYPQAGFAAYGLYTVHTRQGNKKEADELIDSALKYGVFSSSEIELIAERLTRKTDEISSDSLYTLLTLCYSNSDSSQYIAGLVSKAAPTVEQEWYWKQRALSSESSLEAMQDHFLLALSLGWDSDAKTIASKMIETYGFYPAPYMYAAQVHIFLGEYSQAKEHLSTAKTYAIEEKETEEIEALYLLAESLQNTSTKVDFTQFQYNSWLPLMLHIGHRIIGWTIDPKAFKDMVHLKKQQLQIAYLHGLLRENKHSEVMEFLDTLASLKSPVHLAFFRLSADPRIDSNTKQHYLQEIQDLCIQWDLPLHSFTAQ